MPANFVPQVVAALGAADERGVFKVQEIAIPGKAPPPALPTPETAVSCSTAGAKPEGFDSTGKVVAFVSGKFSERMHRPLRSDGKRGRRRAWPRR